MSATVGRNGRVYGHAFDHDEAYRLRAEGVPVRDIAARYGVTMNSIYYATSAHYRVVRRSYSAMYQSNHRCTSCGAPCSFNRSRQSVPRCQDCSAEAQATSVRPTTLRCQTCGEWKSDLSFQASSRHPHRRDRRGECIACGSAARRAYRNRGKVPCEDCGKLVEGKGRQTTRTGNNGRRIELDPERPYLCLPCARARFRAQRVAA